MQRFLWGILLIIVAFSGLLAVTGSYYETNDDMQIELFIRGITTTQHADLSIFMVGLNGIFDFLYDLSNNVPWYGLTVIGLLLVSYIIYYISIYDIIKKTPILWFCVLLLVACYFIYFTHALIVNFTRTGILLAATASFAYLTRPLNRKGWVNVTTDILLLLCVGIAWAIRPDAGLMGAILVLPVAFGLGNPKAILIKRVPSVVFLLVSLQIVHSYSVTPEEASWRSANVYIAKIIDYESAILEPHTSIDTLASSTIQWYGINDHEVANVGNYKRLVHTNYKYWFGHIISKQYLSVSNFLKLFAPEILFCLLLTFGAFFLRKDKFLLCYTLLLICTIAGLTCFLWLPNRIISSITTVWVMVALWRGAYLGFFDANVIKRTSWVSLLLVALLFKIVMIKRTANSMKETQHKQEQIVLRLEQIVNNRLLVNQGVFYFFDCLSPLKIYFKSSNPQLNLSGWPSMNPSQLEWIKQLSGEANYVKALQELAVRDDVVWVMSPEFAHYFKGYLRKRRALIKNTKFEFIITPVQPLTSMRNLWQYKIKIVSKTI